MFFSAVSIVSSFEADDLVRYIRFGRGGREKNNWMLLCAILTQFDLEQKRGGENRFCTAALSKQK